MNDELNSLVDTYIGYVNNKSRPDEHRTAYDLNFSEIFTYIDVIYELSRLLGRPDKETSQLFTANLKALDGEK